MNRVLIKDIGKVITGNTPSKSNLDYYDSNDIFFVKPDIINDLEVTNIKYTKEYISEKARNKARIVKRDTVFVTCIGTIGKIGIASGNEFAFNQQINAIEPNDKVLPRYLAYNLLFNKKRLIDIANAPVVPIINKTQFENFSIKIDKNLDKQKRIVEVLDKVKLIIYKRQEQLESLDRLIKSQFIKIFGDPIKNTMNWKVEKIENLFCLISRGKQPTYLEESEIKVINQACIYWKGINWENVKYHDPLSKKKTLELKDGDILINSTGTGTLGRCTVFSKPNDNCIYVADSHVTVLRASNKINPIFYKCFFCIDDTQRNLYAKCVNGSTNQIELSKGKLSQMTIIIPPISLQEQFVAFVEQSNKSKFIVQQNLYKLQELFDSLMQQFFKEV